MKVKATRLLPLLVLLTAFFAGCSTPVAINPTADPEQTARYQAGFFYAPIEANANRIFRVAIAEMDRMGYFRTGELHEDNRITIYARKVGDERVTVRIEQIAPAQSEVRIRVGTLGNLPESQNIFAKIRDAL